MEYWAKYNDERFDTEEDAYTDYLENEEADYLACFLEEEITLPNILYWAMRQDAFWEAFDEEIARARQSAFENQYSNWVEEDEE